MLEVNRLQPVPEFSPQLSEEQVRESFRSRIGSVAIDVQAPIRVWLRNLSVPLFFMNEHFAEVWTKGQGLPWKGRIDREQGQNILQEVMREYGFDESKHYRRGEDKDYKNGLRIENLSFPSQTIPGLEFYRTVGYSTATGEPAYVNWSVVDKGPWVRLKLLQQPARQSGRSA